MEKFNQTEKPAKGQEPPRESIDEVLERVLQNGKELGAGEDGVVFKIDLRTLTKEERLLLAGKGTDAGEEVDDLAVKILKIYNPKLGDHEFKMQKRAHDVLSGKKNVAKVPNTTGARDQHINKETADHLNRHGSHLEDKVELIIMDYIDGQDFGSMMYDFALKNMGHKEEYIMDLSYGQKEQMVGQELGFEQPNVNSARTPEEKESAQAITFDRNEKKLLKYLKKIGFQVDTVIFEKVDNAILELNKNGIFHNDLHKQNIMIGVDGEVYIIDFGRASNKKIKGGIADKLFSVSWKNLGLSKKEELEQMHDRELAEIKRTGKDMLTRPDEKKRIDAFVKDVIDRGNEALEKEFALSRGNDRKLEQFLTTLHIIRESGDIDREMIDAFTKSLGGREHLRPFEKNKIKSYNRIIN
ncbi:MAG: phosphotransferase [Minisyncoccia bacterium]